MPRRTIAPIAGRGQAGVPRAPTPMQTAHPAALMVPLDQLLADPGQPRRHFDENALNELAESIKYQGILQPLLVREDGALGDGRQRYVIIAGGRRYRAAQLASLATVPVIVHAESGGPELRILQLIENLQREDLDALEEAVAIRELMQLASLSLEGVATRIGKTKAYAQRRVDLLYDPRLTEAVRRGAINASVAVELRYFSEEQRGRYLDRIAGGERLEVAQLREEKRRAREILFGNAPRRGAGVGNGSSTGTARPTGEVPGDGASYRIDTEGSPTPLKDTSSETSKLADRAGLDVPASEEARGVGGTKSYRIDTTMETSDAPTSVDNGAGQDPGSRWPGLPDRLADDTTATRWAASIADQILLHDRATPDHGALTIALQAWRDAGSPAGWGNSLLRVLAERLGCL